MITEKATIGVEVIYSDDKEHRYLVRRIWDNTLPHACVIMLSPSRTANTIAMDMTSMYTINNAYHQEFGAVSVMNIFSGLDSDLVNTKENDDMLAKVCKEADKIILAWGKGSLTKKVLSRLDEVYKLMEPHKKKLMEISDGEDTGFHPLGRTVRLHWELVPFKLPTAKQSKQEEAKP